MKTSLITIWILVLIVTSAICQEQSFTVRLSHDTVQTDQPFRIEYEILNLNGVSSPPDFHPFMIAGGPNTASSFSMINGKVTQKITYSYTLRTAEAGEFTIQPAKIQSDNDLWLSPEVQIVVVESNTSGTPSKAKNLEYKSDIRRDDTQQSKPARKIRKI